MDPIGQVVAGTEQQNPAMSPPKDQAEYTQRVGMWQQFQDKMKNDPAARFALAQVASHLLQPIQPGQSTLGHIGQAFGLGTNAYALANAQQQETARAEQELAMRGRESDARVAQAGAQTRLTEEQIRTAPFERERVQADAKRARADAAFSEQSLTRRLQEIDAKIAQSTSQTDYYKALGEYNRIKADIERQYGGRREEAEIAQRLAAAHASRASAAHANALSQRVQAELAADNGWVHSAPKIEEDGSVLVSSGNKTTGENRVVRSTPPMDLANAVARAKAELKAINDSTPGQLVGDSRERLAAYEQRVGAPVKSAAEALAKLTERYRAGGVYVTITDRNGNTRIVKQEDTPSQSQTLGQPTAAPGTQLPPEVQQALQANRGQSGTYTAPDGSQWRFDGRGGATRIAGSAAGPATPAPAAAAQPQAQSPQQSTPVVRDRASMANDPTLKGLDIAIQQAAAQKDSAKVQELTKLREQHIARNYMP